MFFLCNTYLIKGVKTKRKYELYLNYKISIINNKKNINRLNCYKKKVKAKELRKLSTEDLEKEITKCRLDIQMFQQKGFYDIHNFNIHYEKNARRKLAQLLTIYYERYLDNNIRIKT
ncbi:apicoplast ribosomal protein L29 precursor, putative [Plasmodium gallinaceum]|uniref:Apicoplast ribosomal protein L29, putative n=1 Tax=Plasmodium gallinaceum TaxID=5849 RepID=A0A1J1GY44_PLAGA|nr:apicoplast ribosomal protein L29 precursor, putative [Plasmodium gallinaceum]CRG95928.1 apicoplast ribosomal protein L29 precursor, putative [Plasmodium gallinaceum]